METEDFSAYVEDATLSEAERGNILAQISSTVRELIAAEEDVVSAEAQLKAAQDRVRNLKENTLPMLMDEAQQKRLTTLEGYEVSRSEIIRASISAENMPRAVTWLNANGQGSIVKRELKLNFGKGEDQKAAEAFDVLREHHFAPTDKLSVHPQTLGAVVRELLEAGREIPMDVLGVYVQPVVKVSRPK